MTAPRDHLGRAPARVALAAAATVAAALVQLGLAWPAAAHAELVTTQPAAGAPVTTVDSVRLSFSEALAPEFSTLAVIGPGGVRVESGASTVSGAEISVPVKVTAAGAYTVSYRVLSADGHPIEGSYALSHAPTTVTTAGPAQPSSGPPATPIPAPAPTPSPAATWGMGGGVLGSAAAVVGLAWYRRTKDSRTQDTG